MCPAEREKLVKFIVSANSGGQFVMRFSVGVVIYLNPRMLPVTHLMSVNRQSETLKYYIGDFFMVARLFFCRHVVLGYLVF